VLARPYARLGIAVALITLTGCGAAARQSVPTSPTAGAKTESSSTPAGHTVRAAATLPYTSFQAEFAALRSSIAEIRTAGCDGSTYVATGFAVDSTHVLTAGHVVAGMSSMSININGNVLPATIIGIDASGDLALLQMDSPVPGPYIPLSDTSPQIGEQVAALGYPLGSSLTMTQGSVSDLNQTITVSGTQLSGLVQTDASINPGNSGGPLIALNGTSQGIVDAGNTQVNATGYAVSPTYAESEVRYWIAHPQTISLPLCDPAESTAPTTSQATAPVSPPVSYGLGTDQAITDTFNTYFSAIDSGDYQTAWDLMTPDQQATNGSLYEWGQGLSTVTDSNVDVLDVFANASGQDFADVGFQSTQSGYQGPDGDTCDNWTLEYAMSYQAGTWLIDTNAGIDGITHTSC
jgi:serine protease Do